jgi:poly(beta-D-mannuronate) lyase
MLLRLALIALRSSFAALRPGRALAPLLAAPLLASAATYTVTSFSDLQTRINAAAAGDTIVVANGTYSADATLSIRCAGTATAPITIAAETIGGVEIRGSRGISFSSPAAYVTLQGFKLTHAAAISIPSGTRFIRITRNVIELAIPRGSDVSYLNISGDDVEIDRNELRNKSTLGEMLDIAGSGSQVARRLWVHHNYFHDFTSPGGNGAETIRWGLSGLSLSTGDGICEYNLFVRCEGENEMISNKSSGNTYRYNTVLDSPGGEISQRHGDNCRYYGNYMRNTQGIRIYGDRHLIFSNYLENNSVGINMGNGDGDVHAGDALTSHDRPDDNVVVFNTLINNATQYEMGGRTGGLGATNTTFANNVLVGGTNAISISGTAPYTNPTWAGNLIWAAANVGNIPGSGYAVTDPLLVADANSVYHLRPDSPAIDTAVGSYPGVTLDLDGQARADPKDRGADEYSTAAVVARPLTPADVGPNSSEVVAPALLRGPVSHSMADGDVAVFRVTASGSDLAYQWNFNGTPLFGATSSFVRLLANATTVGRYSCTVSNAGGSVTSGEAQLSVITTSDPGRLTNLSIRSNAGSQDKTLTVGAVSTAGSSGAGIPVLIRVGGPSLAQFSLTEFLVDPQLNVFDGNKIVVATNDNWAGDADVTTIGRRFAAYDFVAANSLDAALYLPSLPIGRYTIEATSVTGGEGIALVEVYEANPAYDPSASRLVNASARTQVGLDDNVLVAGFGISGSTSKTLLLRGVGPRLTDFQVSDVLGNPKLELFQGQEVLESNDDWGGDAVLAKSFDAVAAFGLLPDSKDAAMLVTLQPGSYTLQVSGVGRTTGIALVEVYEAK